MPKQKNLDIEVGDLVKIRKVSGLVGLYGIVIEMKGCVYKDRCQDRIQYFEYRVQLFDHHWYNDPQSWFWIPKVNLRKVS
jgi:hypothetical protein